MNRLWLAFLSTIAGLRWAARHEPAISQELVVLVVAVPASLLVASAGWVRIALIGSIMLILTVELLNTAVEKLCDRLVPGTDPAIKLVKDLGSAAVFTAITLAGMIWLFALAGNWL